MSEDRLIADEAFVGRMRDALNAQSLTPELAGRLSAARRRAVASVDAPIPRAPGAWVPVGALASTLLVVGVLSGAIDRNSDRNSLRNAAPPLDDELQFAVAQDLDVLDDLEFAAWLDSDGADAS